MNPNHIALLVDAGIPVIAGLYVSLLAFRVIGSKPGENPKMDQWHERFGPWMKVLGPLCVALAIVVAIAKLVR